MTCKEMCEAVLSPFGYKNGTLFVKESVLQLLGLEGNHDFAQLCHLFAKDANWQDRKLFFCV